MNVQLLSAVHCCATVATWLFILILTALISSDQNPTARHLFSTKPQTNTSFELDDHSGVITSCWVWYLNTGSRYRYVEFHSCFSTLRHSTLSSTAFFLPVWMSNSNQSNLWYQHTFVAPLTSTCKSHTGKLVLTGWLTYWDTDVCRVCNVVTMWRHRMELCHSTQHHIDWL